MKRIITLVLAVMTAVSLVACGDKASATVDAEALGRALAERVQFDTTVSAMTFSSSSFSICSTTPATSGK